MLCHRGAGEVGIGYAAYQTSVTTTVTSLAQAAKSHHTKEMDQYWCLKRLVTVCIGCYLDNSIISFL